MAWIRSGFQLLANSGSDWKVSAVHISVRIVKNGENKSPLAVFTWPLYYCHFRAVERLTNLFRDVAMLALIFCCCWSMATHEHATGQSRDEAAMKRIAWQHVIGSVNVAWPSLAVLSIVKLSLWQLLLQPYSASSDSWFCLTLAENLILRDFHLRGFSSRNSFAFLAVHVLGCVQKGQRKAGNERVSTFFVVYFL